MCADCGAPMVLRFTAKLNRKFYGCSRWPACQGTHGAHQGTGEPLGTPANAETKAARIRAHEAFDELWKSGLMKRRAAYRWMAEVLGLSREAAHISRMDLATCERLVQAVRARPRPALADQVRALAGGAR
jgi:ssDNA-binding Zn-finger/Zn-ribbon topoisomerase 1